MTRLTFLQRLTEYSYLASIGGRDPFAIRQTTEGWKTEGNRDTDGALCGTEEELLALIEECAR